MNELNKLVGERIAQIRKYNRINQSDLADKLGKSLRTVQKYESGEIDIPLSTLADIAKVLNTTMNYLVGYDSSHIKTVGEIVFLLDNWIRTSDWKSNFK